MAGINFSILYNAIENLDQNDQDVILKLKKILEGIVECMEELEIEEERP